MRALFLIALVGCGGGGGSKVDAGPTRVCSVATTASCMEAANHSDLAWIEPNVFAVQCAFSGCHTGEATPAGRIDLKGVGMSHGDLVNVDSMVANGRKIVVPGQPRQSYMMMMLQLFPPTEMEPTPVMPPPSDIGFMPQGTDNEPICCQKIDAIERWITAGAAAN